MLKVTNDFYVNLNDIRHITIQGNSKETAAHTIYITFIDGSHERFYDIAEDDVFKLRMALDAL